jgi:hypothetical protein
MFPLRPDDNPEPDVIGTAGTAGGRRERWWRVLGIVGVLALAGIVAVTFLSSSASRGHHGAAPVPSRRPVVPVPVLPSVLPSQAWVTSLNIAIWPMPGSGTSKMFAGGLAGAKGWELTVRGTAAPGHRCVADVLLDGADAYPVSVDPPLRTKAGDLTFIALGPGSPGVGVGLIQRAGPGQAWIDPAGIGGLQVNVPVLAETVCGKTYYLGGFAYPLAGKLDLSVSGGGTYARDYAIPVRLSHPKTARVWESTGLCLPGSGFAQGQVKEKRRGYPLVAASFSAPQAAEHVVDGLRRDAALNGGLPDRRQCAGVDLEG